MLLAGLAEDCKDLHQPSLNLGITVLRHATVDAQHRLECMGESELRLAERKEEVGLVSSACLGDHQTRFARLGVRGPVVVGVPQDGAENTPLVHALQLEAVMQFMKRHLHGGGQRDLTPCLLPRGLLELDVLARVEALRGSAKGDDSLHRLAIAQVTQRQDLHAAEPLVGLQQSVPLRQFGCHRLPLAVGLGQRRLGQGAHDVPNLLPEDAAELPPGADSSTQRGSGGELHGLPLQEDRLAADIDDVIAVHLIAAATLAALT
mmetsp:Transcript_43847/g.113220  ORF Transcript_43847/g.113220 Transcript_43847/m.113220 type:complete len:262 (-) Transcript_43847:75-860(-)